MENHSFEWKLEDEWLVVKVRLSIFIIIGACAGLPALVWSVSDLIHYRKNGHSISIFIILLLLTDFVELFMSPYILLQYLFYEMFSCEDGTCWVLSCLWWSSRGWGILLNQLVALEGLLSVKYPRNTACVFSSPCFIILYIVVFLCVFICAVDWRLFLIVALVLIVLLITWIVPCVVSCSAGCRSQTSRKPDYHILAVFIYTLLMLVLVPHLLLLFYFLHFLPSIFFIPYYLMSLRLISDPLLCVLVCRQNISIQTSQTSEEIVQFEEVW